MYRQKSTHTGVIARFLLIEYPLPNFWSTFWADAIKTDTIHLNPPVWLCKALLMRGSYPRSTQDHISLIRPSRMVLVRKTPSAPPPLRSRPSHTTPHAKSWHWEADHQHLLFVVSSNRWRACREDHQDLIPQFLIIIPTNYRIHDNCGLRSYGLHHFCMYNNCWSWSCGLTIKIIIVVYAIIRRDLHHCCVYNNCCSWSVGHMKMAVVRPPSTMAVDGLLVVWRNRDSGFDAFIGRSWWWAWPVGNFPEGGISCHQDHKAGRWWDEDHDSPHLFCLVLSGGGFRFLPLL